MSSAERVGRSPSPPGDIPSGGETHGGICMPGRARRRPVGKSHPAAGTRGESRIISRGSRRSILFIDSLSARPERGMGARANRLFQRRCPFRGPGSLTHSKTDSLLTPCSRFQWSFTPATLGKISYNFTLLRTNDSQHS